jgi:NAD(P)-dependent dehydrogenase (short-subunit alcohol dehydrogenase family)
MPTFPSHHVSLVTGASTGIGAATALSLARCGSAVAVHYNRSGLEAQQVVERITKMGGRAFPFQADLSRPSGPSQLAEDVIARFARIDVLVNNAGSMIGRRTLLEITDEFWDKVFATNVSSVIRMIRSTAPNMISRGSGSIVNVSSIAARNGGGPGVTAYAAAKGAVLTMTKSIAKELISSGIRVNAVNPGIIKTPFHEQFTTEEQMKAMVLNIPQGRPGTSEEVASVIAFLASDEASHIAGEAIEINGGMWMD